MTDILHDSGWKMVMRNLVKAGAIHAEQRRGAMRRKALGFLSAHVNDEGDGNSIGEARSQCHHRGVAG
jgi:hypothetical protein